MENEKQPVAFRVTHLSILSAQSEIDEVRQHVLDWVEGQDETVMMDLAMRCGQALTKGGAARLQAEEFPLVCLLAWAGGTLARLHHIESNKQNFEGN